MIAIASHMSGCTFALADLCIRSATYIIATSLQGERRLRELEAMVGYSADKQPKESSAALSPESYDEDSWINIRDEEDPRGRVGVQWPWESGGSESSK